MTKITPEMRQRAGDNCEHVDALLYYIAETALNYTQLLQFSFPRSSNPALLSRKQIERSLKNGPQKYINDRLTELGGLPVLLANEGEETKHLQILSALHGFDFINASLNWAIKGAPSGLGVATRIDALLDISEDAHTVYGSTPVPPSPAV
ncbi:MAG TPA: hypothetical protein VHD60_02400 [Candidatus Saccharimonadales bacterium]|nr:hypothetical protein [Candidatus Saccharimonadales bacterium]